MLTACFTPWDCCHRFHLATPPPVGLLLCTDKNDRVVRYALAGSNHPIAIASYDLLPPAEHERRLSPD
ncbi:MAG TPA: PDDEXK nuclease domain-containing protein [Microbacteriaceae bacterium]|nr:PDDEXK nuclease domain-containing protein [Microbacteriaceae bacterium]